MDEPKPIPAKKPNIPIRLFNEHGKLLPQPLVDDVEYKTLEIPMLNTVEGELPYPDEMKALCVQKQPDGTFDIRLMRDQMDKLARLIMGYEELLVRAVQGARITKAMAPWMPVMLMEIGHKPGELIDWEKAAQWMDERIRAGIIAIEKPEACQEGEFVSVPPVSHPES